MPDRQKRERTRRTFPDYHEGSPDISDEEKTASVPPSQANSTDLLCEEGSRSLDVAEPLAFGSGHAELQQRNACAMPGGLEITGQRWRPTSTASTMAFQNVPIQCNPQYPPLGMTGPRGPPFLWQMKNLQPQIPPQNPPNAPQLYQYNHQMSQQSSHAQEGPALKPNKGKTRQGEAARKLLKVEKSEKSVRGDSDRPLARIWSSETKEGVQKLPPRRAGIVLFEKKLSSSDVNVKRSDVTLPMVEFEGLYYDIARHPGPYAVNVEIWNGVHFACEVKWWQKETGGYYSLTKAKELKKQLDAEIGQYLTCYSTDIGGWRLELHEQPVVAVKSKRSRSRSQSTQKSGKKRRRKVKVEDSFSSDEDYL